MAATDLNFHTVDGSTIAAVFRAPADLDAPVPGVVLCQGLSGVKHLVLPEIADKFARAGIASIAFDYRGHGESHGGSAELVDPRARVDDAVHALAALFDRPEVDANRVGIYGLSYGGPVAICAAARDTRVRAVVSCSGPGDGQDMMRGMRTADQWLELEQRVAADRARVAKTGQSELVDIQVLFPFSEEFMRKYTALSGKGTSSMDNEPAAASPKFRLSSADAMLDFHPGDAVARLSGRPLLMINGEQDDCATIEQVRSVYDRAQEPKKLVVMPGRDHVDMDTGPGLEDQSQLAADWFGDKL